MLLSLFTSGASIQDVLISLLLSLPMVLLALSIHEAAHGYIAWKCGDPTAYNMGRLTLNPKKHLDLAGTICMIVFGFGWAKPVPINTRYFRNPKRGMVLSAIAGPAANLLLGLILAVFFGIFVSLNTYFAWSGTTEFWLTFTYWASNLFYIGAQLNFFLMVFNLLPIPPFDGSRFALAFLPTKQYFAVMKYERHIMIGLLVALFAMSYVFNISPFGWVANKLTYLIAQPVYDLMFLILPF